jgi:hypothetical protein
MTNLEYLRLRTSAKTSQMGGMRKILAPGFSADNEEKSIECVVA